MLNPFGDPVPLIGTLRNMIEWTSATPQKLPKILVTTALEQYNVQGKASLTY